MGWNGIVWYGMVYMLWYIGYILHLLVWYGMIWYGMIWYDMVWYIVLYFMLWCVWCGMVCYDMVSYCMVWYGMVLLVNGVLLSMYGWELNVMVISFSISSL